MIVLVWGFFLLVVLGRLYGFLRTADMQLMIFNTAARVVAAVLSSIAVVTPRSSLSNQQW